MENMIITGADGFIGSHLVDFYIKKNYKIFALKKPGELVLNLTHYTNNKIDFLKEEYLEFFDEYVEIPTNDERITLLDCDLRDNILMEKFIFKIKPKIILHFGAQSLVLASWKDPIETMESNAIGTINVLESVKKHNLKTRIIVACSSAEYGTSTELKRPLRESDPLLAIHPYGISKIATELLSRQYFLNFGIDTLTLRFFNQTGIRKINDVCSDFVRDVAKIELGLIKPIIKVGNLNTYRDITGIKDTIQAIYLAIKKGKAGETYNVCSGRKIQIRQILNFTLGFSNKKIKVIESSPEKLRSLDEEIIEGDNSKIIRELGWKITAKIEETLKEMFTFWINYYKKYGLTLDF
ncbi:MAG: GDP-mannose 4,6-dehydratase [Promethearchaeota archaeon]